MERELPIINFVIGCAACQSKNVELVAATPAMKSCSILNYYGLNIFISQIMYIFADNT